MANTLVMTVTPPHLRERERYELLKEKPAENGGGQAMTLLGELVIGDAVME